MDVSVFSLLCGSISDFEPDAGGHEAGERRPQGEAGQVRGCLTSEMKDGSDRVWPGHKIAQKSAWQPWWWVNNLLLLAPRRSTLAVMERHGGDDKSTVAGVSCDHYHCWSLKCRLTAGHIHTNKSCECKHTSKQPSAATRRRRRIRLQSTWWIWQSSHVHTHLHTHLECWSHSHRCDLVTARLHDVEETESVSCAGGSNVLLIHK